MFARLVFQRNTKRSLTTATPRVPSILIEEETIPGYKASSYYPVRLGQTFQDRYRAVVKLGYGSASTVWLCRDIATPNNHVALKVYIHDSKVLREVSIYAHINELQSKHEGRAYIRPLLDSFKVQGPHGEHMCLVHQPLGISLAELKRLAPGGLFGADLIRQTFRYVLTGLDFLHSDANGL